MKITTLSPYKGNTWQLALDDSKELYFLHVSIVHKFHLEEGEVLEESQWEQICLAEQERKGYSYACYLLDIRSYSYQEMFHKLETKYEEEACFAIVDRLAANGLIQDARYAEQKAYYYIEGKRFGFHRARQEMRRRGLLDSHIEAALAPYTERTEEILEELIAGKYQRYFSDPSDQKQIEKGKAALVRQGYGFAEINRAVRKKLQGES